MTSSRQLPSSYNENTYGDETRDYTSLATWESDTDNDLVTATEGEVLTCYDDDAPYEDNINMGGATTNSSYFRVIRAADGQRGDSTTGVRFEKTGVAADTSIFRISTEDYTRCHDIAAKVSTTGVKDAFCFEARNSPNARFVGCYAYDSSVNNSSAFIYGFRFLRNGTSNAGYCINCVADNIQQHKTTYYGGAFGIETNTFFSNYTVTAYFYNCTAIDCDHSFRINTICKDGTFTGYAKNCISQNADVSDFSIRQLTEGPTASWDKTTCVEDDSVVFNADGYHLASADTSARGEGTDLSADGTFAFDDDIDGDSRIEWDIGADEYTEPENINIKINIGDEWKYVTKMQINIGDTWKEVTKAQINIGDTWKTIFDNS
jgi:hypothetical protein